VPDPAADDDPTSETGAAPNDELLDEAQLALLAAGVRLLARLDRDDLTRLVSAIAVADEAAMHRQTIYRRWSGHPALFDEIIRYVTDPTRSVGVEHFSELEDEAEEVDRDDPAAEIRRLSSQTFGRFTGDPTQMVRMLLWSVHLNDDEVADAMRHLYRNTDAAAAAAFGPVGRALGIEPRPPFTLESIALLINALRDGLVLHLGIDPDRVPPTFYGDVMVAVTSAVVRRIDDPNDDLDVDEVFRRTVRGPSTPSSSDERTDAS
jgi:AcrR family transcriptional regulator